MLQEARTIALRVGDWKYIANTPLKNVKAGKLPPATNAELYNLESDPSEQTNIISQNPEKAASMAKQLGELIEAEGVR